MPRTPQLFIRFGWKSDRGHVRKNNEDYVSWFIPAENQAGRLKAPALFVVADGVGGHAAGEVASNLVCTTLVEGFRSAADKTRIPELLNQLIQKANSEVLQAATQPGQTGMASTVVCAVFHANRFTVAHVGDSRAYLFFQDQIRLLTHDHTVLNEMLRQGLLDPGDAENQVPRNILSRAIGKKGTIHPDVLGPMELPRGSRILLCSDGINGLLEDERIESILREHVGQPQAACDALVRQANERGGLDNASAIVIAVD